MQNQSALEPLPHFGDPMGNVPMTDGVASPMDIPPSVVEPPPSEPLPWMTNAVPTETVTMPDSVSSELPEEMRKPRIPAKSVSWFFPLVFLPLLLYAILASVLAGYLWMRLQSRDPSPFDQSPDWEGDTPGVRKDKKLSFDRKFATQSLPAHLRVRLGDTIRVGDLEVTPLKVDRRKVGIITEGGDGRTEESPHDGLVLHLHLKNMGSDYSFTPIDNYFDRHWRPGNDGSPPLTVLQAGAEHFFGGPAKWTPLRSGRRERREWINGRVNIDRVGLAPGKEQNTILATDAWDAAVSQYLFGVDAEGNSVGRAYKGKLLWRVHVRRGLIDWKGRMLPATAVIGVEFTEIDYAG
jgi:hypothetical protein